MTEWIEEIIHNLAILLSLALIFHLVGRQRSKPWWTNRLLFGVLFGGVAVFSMVTAFEYRSGVVFDGRSIILVLAGLFGGGTTGGIATAIAGVYRGLLGGDGVWAGMATILVAGSSGIGCGKVIRHYNWPPTPWQLWGIGVIVHLLVLGCMLLLPPSIRSIAIANMAIPFLVAYPLVLVVLGMVLGKKEVWSSSLARLRHAEWLFSEAQKVTRFGSWEYHLDTDHLVATPHFHELLGLSATTAPLSLQDLFGRLHRDDWDKVRLAFDAALRDHEAIDVQGRFLTDDGRQFWGRLVGKPMVIAGKATQLVGNLIDITRRKTSELALRASEERLQAIIDHAPALICLCDQEGKVALANRRFTLFGLPAENVVGRPLYELLPRGGAIEQWIDDLMALRAGEPVEFEEILHHADGTEHTYLASKFLLASAGDHPDTICYIAADISELRLALANLQKTTAELTVKNDELARFGYTVSHDLKAPLLTIGSFSALLQEDLAGGSTAQALDDLGHIQGAVVKMHQLIDELLELSRSGRTTGGFADVDLNEVVADVLLLLTGEIRQAGAEVAANATLPVVRGDAARLRQVLQNLVQNALKYRDTTRQLRIALDWARNPDGSVHVAVRDNGRGIAAADQERVFTLFEQLGDGSEGAGIGLALARRIMKKHGGDIRIESAGPGTGSAFILQFPPLPVKKTFATGNGI